VLDATPRSATLSLEDSVAFLRAAGETTRLRLLTLLARLDLTVSDLTEILGQSQPRVSRHLKLLLAAGLVERYQEGAWAYFRASRFGAAAIFNQFVFAQTNGNDPLLLRDWERLQAVKARRAASAAAYFAENAASWNTLRSLHVSESRLEACMRELLGPGKVQNLLDVGTGTGRMLELFAPQARHATGIDASHAMLSLARAQLEAAAISNAQVRHGDIFQLPIAVGSQDLAIIHQVLHYLDDPALALREVAQTLSAGGRLLIVDFAPHTLDFLREQHAHQRLGFANGQMCEWLQEAGLEVEDHRQLAPERDKTDQLTVSLWLARNTASETSQPAISSIRENSK
jgi:ArsR family transcriptional regulator